MTDLDELIRQLSRMKVQTGSLVCLGCGLEHNCGIHGCAVLRRAVSAVRELDERRANAVRPADTDPALIAALRCSATVGGDKDCASCAYGCRVEDQLPPEVQVLLRVLADEPTCDCDRMALDAAQRLEELTGVDGNG
nr:MAG TPA: hypothetical protein [Caudoviricetes sp.]